MKGILSACDFFYFWLFDVDTLGSEPFVSKNNFMYRSRARPPIVLRVKGNQRWNHPGLHQREDAKYLIAWNFDVPQCVPRALGTPVL